MFELLLSERPKKSLLQNQFCKGDYAPTEVRSDIKTILYGRVPRLEKTYVDEIRTLVFGRVPRIESLYFDEVTYLVYGKVPPIRSTKTELVKTVAYGRAPSLNYSECYWFRIDIFSTN